MIRKYTVDALYWDNGVPVEMYRDGNERRFLTWLGAINHAQQLNQNKHPESSVIFAAARV